MLHILYLIFILPFYVPILNAVLFLVKALPGHDLGVAIILVTIAIKVVLYIPSLSAIKSSRQLQSLQPRLNAIKQQFKNDKEGLAREQMKLYKESRVNPFSSCLPTLIQFPILIALYQVFFNGLNLDAHHIVHASQQAHLWGSLRTYFATTPINTISFHFLDLTKTGSFELSKLLSWNLVLALLAGAATFWQTQMLASPKEPKIKEAKDEDFTSAMNRQNKYLMPLLFAFISFRFSAGLALYWFVSSLFTVIQQYFFLKRHPLSSPGASAPMLDAGNSPK